MRLRGIGPAAVIVAQIAVCAHAEPVAPPPPSTSTAVPAGPGQPFDAELDEAFALLDRRQPQEAERRFAALIERDALTDRQRARALRGLGQARIVQERRAAAADPVARAIVAAQTAGDRRELAWARQLTGMLHYGEGRIDEARAIWNEARSDFVATGDRYGEFEVLTDLTLLITGIASRPLLERAYAIAREEDDPLLEARARKRWAHALLDAAHPGAALIELERAVSLMRPLGARAEAALGDALALKGWALRAHGAPERAVPVYREAIRVARVGNDLNAQVWNYLGLGNALAELGHEQQAQSAISRGLAAARRTGIPTNVRFLAQADGWIALKQRHWARAAAMLETAQAMPGLDSTVLPLVHLAHAYRELGRLEEALATAARAVDLARRLQVVDGELQAIIELAQVCNARGDLDAAERHLSDAIGRLESYRSALAPVDFLKQGFGDRFTDAYGVNVDLLMRRGRPLDALAAAERSRSRAFADLLATRRASEAEEEATARGQWTLGGAEAADSTPVPADSARSVPALSGAELVALARGLQTTLVVYWIHEAGSYGWVVDGDGAVNAARIAMPVAALRRAVRRAVNETPVASLTVSGDRTVASAAVSTEYRVLYRALWQPLEPWLPRAGDARITILPHGPLFTLPFAALVDDGGRYLIERFAFHFAPSGAVLSEAAARAHRPSVAEATALLVGDPSPIPAAEGGLHLPGLRAARREVRSIAAVVNGRVDLLTGPRASESAVRRALPDARLVHFATHAVVRDSDPLGSHLMLAVAGGSPRRDSHDDGRLTASEIAGFRLSSDLVVLGACRSARGAVSSDGIAGLARSFMAAGAPSVVATLWDVADVPTSRVMTGFYRAYLAGVSKDRALRAAQLRLLRDLRAGRVSVDIGGTTIAYPEHPHVWAGVILVGAP